jgi:hypothetical protein
MTTTIPETSAKSLLEESVRTYTYPSPRAERLSTDNNKFVTGVTNCNLELSLRRKGKSPETDKYDLHIEVNDVGPDWSGAFTGNDNYMRLPKTVFPGHDKYSNEFKDTRLEYNNRTADQVRKIIKSVIPIINELAPILRKANYAISCEAIGFIDAQKD